MTVAELANRPSTEVFGYDPLDSDPAWKRRTQLTSSKSFSAATPITQPFTAATTYKYNDPPTPKPASLTRTHSMDYTSTPTLPMDRAAMPAWQAKLAADSKPSWQTKFAGDIVPEGDNLEPLSMSYRGSALPMLRKRNDPNSITSRILAGKSDESDGGRSELKSMVDAELEDFDYPRPEPTRKSSKMGAVSSAPSLSSFQSPFASSPFASQKKLTASLASTGLGAESRIPESKEPSSSSSSVLRNGTVGNNGHSLSHLDDLEEDTLIPCEFCDTPISILKLIKHQVGNYFN